MNTQRFIYTIISQSAAPETASDIPTEGLTQPTSEFLQLHSQLPQKPQQFLSPFQKTARKVYNTICDPKSSTSSLIYPILSLVSGKK